MKARPARASVLHRSASIAQVVDAIKARIEEQGKKWYLNEHEADEYDMICTDRGWLSQATAEHGW